MNNKELIKIINDAAKKNLKKLDLVNIQLTQLPSEIAKLTNLIELSLANNQLTQLPPEIGLLTKLRKNTESEYGWGLKLKNNNFNVPEEVLEKKEPQEIIKDILVSHRKGIIVNGELLISIGTQRDLKEDELAKITKWLNTFKIKAFFILDKDKPDIQLSENSEIAVHEVKQYLTNELFVNHREVRIVNGTLFVPIAIQRTLGKNELAKITEWLIMFRIRAFFIVNNKKTDIQLSENSETAIYEIKQYISNKYQDHISQVYDQKTQTEK